MNTVKYIGEYKFKSNKKNPDGLSLALDFRELAHAFGFIMDHIILTKVGSNKIAIGTRIPDDIEDRRAAYSRDILGLAVPEKKKIETPKIILPGEK